MLILAFESSCDETSVSVVEAKDGRFTVKSNMIASQIETHRLYGGVVPEIASRAHIEAISELTYGALGTAEVAMTDIDAVAVTSNPGLIGALLVGVNFAKALAAAYGKPLVPVDHIKGHVAACYLNEGEVPKPPFIALAASGGHTGIYLVRDYTDFAEIGTTRDDAIGESFDKIGRIIGIPYPAGRGFDELATEGFKLATGLETGFYEAYPKTEAYRSDEYPLPSPAMKDGSLDFSFSGLKTAAINLLNKFEMKKTEISRPLFAAKYTYMAVEAVAHQLSSALEKYPECDLSVSGGVAANSHLRRRLQSVTEKLKRKLFIPPVSLCGDNAAMIAAAAYYNIQKGIYADSSLNASASDSITRENIKQTDR